MSFNRRRNIFTLGDFQTQQQHKAQQQSRRQNSDPFERDPFKIQSYNFHYAERPQFPVQQQPVNRASSRTPAKRFDTYYYNYDFAANRRNKESPAASGFHEYRRRKFLQDQPATTANLFSTQALPGRSLGGFAENGASSSSAGQQHQQQQQLQQRRHQLQSHGSAVPSHVPQQQHAMAGNSAHNSLSCAYVRSSLYPLFHSQNSSRACEFLPALRTVPSNGGAAAHQHSNNKQQNQQQRESGQQRCCSRNSSSHSLQGGRARSASGRRLCAGNSDFDTSCDAKGVNCKVQGHGHGHGASADACCGSGVGGITVTVTDKNNCGRELEYALPSAGNAAYNRRPLQTLPAASSKNVVSGACGGGIVEQKQSSCSGCQININIKGMDDNELSENVTIKIEATDCSNSKNVTRCGTSSSFKPQNALHSNLMQRVCSPGKADNFNLANSKSSETIIIDKHISKFSLSQRQQCDERNSAPECARKRERQSDRDRSRSHSCAQREYDCNRQAEESDSDAERRTLSPCFEPATMPPSQRLLKERMPSIVPWCLNHKENSGNHSQCAPFHTQRRMRSQMPPIDLRQLKTSTPTYSIASTSPRPKFPERKLLNTISAMQRKLDELPVARKAPSHSSLRSNNDNKSINRLQRSMTITSRELKLRRPATPPMPNQGRHQASNKLPLNVNINVYADKLKLMRV